MFIGDLTLMDLLIGGLISMDSYLYLSFRSPEELSEQRPRSDEETSNINDTSIPLLSNDDTQEISQLAVS